MHTRSAFKFDISRGGRARGLSALAALLVAGCVFALLRAEAYAYAPPHEGYPPGQQCTDCHESSSGDGPGPGEPGGGSGGSGGDGGSILPTRKGPHGGYDITTRKCAMCHSVHLAPEGYMLLPGYTARAVCESCHDGTGGKSVYGAIEARGGTVGAAHSIETTSQIPGGDPAGGPRTGMFSGPGNTLTCVDCHSPHDTDTVQPFYGDRARGQEGRESITAAELPTNRLLKRLAGADGEPVERYGSEWCAACHQGFHLAEAVEGSEEATQTRHPVGFEQEIEGEWRFHYDSVRVVASLESSETTWGPLGQSNAGYVMPLGTDGERIGPQAGVGPLCQQCHEDARTVGGTIDGSPVLLPGQEFAVSAYPIDPDSGDNPRFQTFPHESDQTAFIVAQVPDDDENRSYRDGFCLRCHAFAE